MVKSLLISNNLQRHWLVGLVIKTLRGRNERGGEREVRRRGEGGEREGRGRGEGGRER